MRADQRDQVVRVRRDRQRVVDARRWQLPGATFALGDGCLQHRREGLTQPLVTRLGVPFRPQAEQASAVARQRAVDGPARVP